MAVSREDNFTADVGISKTEIRLFCFQAEDGIRAYKVTGVQTCALPIWTRVAHGRSPGSSAMVCGGRISNSSGFQEDLKNGPPQTVANGPSFAAVFPSPYPRHGAKADRKSVV